MNIQNISSLDQAPQPARLANSGAGAVVADQPRVTVELPQAATKQAPQQQQTFEQLKNVVDSINRALKQSNNNLEFSVDNDSKKTVVKLVDKETGDVVRQFPSNEVLAIARSIDRIQQGLLLSRKA